MLDGLLYALVVLVYLGFFGLLLLLCVRTRSRGLMVILITYIGFAVIDAISKPLFDQYVGPWSFGEINNWLTDSMSAGEFLMRSDFIRRFFYYGLISIGLYIIYKEWKHGKFSNTQPVDQEESNE